jgi:Uma2 family endonuclease
MNSADVLEPEIAPHPIVDGISFEIVNDERVELPPMGAPETVMASRISNAIGRVAFPGDLGESVTETLFRLRSKPSVQRRPDVAFVSYARWAKGRMIPPGNAWNVIPDLVVEVVSPTDNAKEILIKVREYFEAGVRRVWVLYPGEWLVYEYDSPRSIRVLGREDALEGGEVIPGFRLPLSELSEGIVDSGPT